MPHLSRRSATVFATVVGAIALAGCSDVAGPRASAPIERNQQQLRAAQRSEKIRNAIAAQEKYTNQLRQVKGVIGTAVGLLPNGDAAVQVLVLDDVPRPIPASLDGVPVDVRVTGLIVARSITTVRARPAPLGYSIGHPSITAGTIGARVLGPTGTVYVLSNNHVLAAANDASLGDPEYQPGPYDGGTSADQIATLSAFKALDFSGANNTIDAAIAVSDVLSLGNATPDDGYGLPNGTIFGDANGDRVFDDRNALLGVAVQKFGRTTHLTRGTITGINASVDVCYEVLFIFCVKAAHFVDQLIIGQSGFSDGGDSGSLIVTDNAGKNPVALLFAGSSTETIANRIDLVLNNFNVSVDGSYTPPPPPPDPVTDVAVMSVTAPAQVTQGTTATVAIVMKNVGNQSVGTFSVLLRDETDNVDFAPKYVSALAPGASVTLNVNWATSTSTSLGTHTLVANSQLIDDNAANNSGSTTSEVVAFVPTVDIHVGNLSGWATKGSNTWSATVEITVHDANHQPLNGATVTGNWSRPGLNSNTCTTGDGGGNGTCIVLFPSISRSYPSVIYAVSNVTYPNRTYNQSLNHDPDGSSNGTGQKVLKP